LRQVELLGLRWADAELEAGTLRVARTLGRVGGAIVIGEPKSKRGRRGGRSTRRKGGADGGTRTHTPSRAAVVKTASSTGPTRRRVRLILARADGGRACVGPHPPGRGLAVSGRRRWESNAR